jgi:NMD protein affecting ribosome stability and mRNA decay
MVLNTLKEIRIYNTEDALELDPVYNVNKPIKMQACRHCGITGIKVPWQDVNEWFPEASDMNHTVIHQKFNIIGLPGH